MLRDPAPELAANAAASLGKLKAREAADDLWTASKHSDGHVRANATKALVEGSPKLGKILGTQTGNSWFAFYLVDRDDGTAKAFTRYWLTLPEGWIKAGTTDSAGAAREEHIPDGLCQLE
jgi:hypothetical protein